MARGGRHGRKGKRGGGKMGQYRSNTGRDTRTDAYSTAARENALFFETYRGLEILSEGELKEMWAALKTDLPNSFRFTSSSQSALDACRVLKEEYIPAIAETEFNGEPVTPPQPVAFYPDELAWDIKIPKAVVRKHKPFAAFQKFLVAETGAGNISRQEVVSMIPPLMLGVKPGMVVLDMCAAPGSKSAQLAEMIHGEEEERVRKVASGTPEVAELAKQDGYDDDGRSSGLLIANDSDYKRAYMLTHQLKRLNLPNVIVTNNDASIYPSIELPQESGARGQLKYDRILADVPCSGDGTARKNLSLWEKWNPRDAIGLHKLQRRILIRALELLKVGGRMVYSTCSMNPIENEAVIASAIEQIGGTSKVQIVDCSADLPLLKRKPGLTTWKAFDRTQASQDTPSEPIFFETYEDFQNHKANILATESNRKIADITPEMFPPASSGEDRVPLERCMRVYPHQQDTGGFFIVVLEKLAPFKAAPAPGKRAEISKAKRALEEDTDESSKRAKTDTDNVAEANGTVAAEETPLAPLVEVEEHTVNDGDVDTVPATMSTEFDDEVDGGIAIPVETPEEPERVERKRRTNEPKAEVFKFLDPNHEAINEVFNFYRIESPFPRDRFLVRNEDGKASKAIYYASALAKHILTTMEGTTLKFVHGGIKMFVRHDTKHAQSCNWRVQTEGIAILQPWCKDRVVVCKEKHIFHHLLTDMFPIFNKDQEDKLGELWPQLQELTPGCCFLVLQPDKSAKDPFTSRMVLPLWRNPGSLNLMCSKDDRYEMLLRMYNDANPAIVDHTQRPRPDQGKKEQEEVVDEKPEIKDEDVMGIDDKKKQSEEKVEASTDKVEPEPLQEKEADAPAEAMEVDSKKE
ncbi:S-adenosyl-L-methionine-dependent methyltransferase [Delitschia confertaspora ATCC 74209]|uniref:S-adenosyl-L-methionine-dependent methyltransferase n=1 Tax=Delitschia confertaspora ATCC 74209 TaxID=1513339 RepID=A0A9P4JFX3_9PLEO|nr:S-adenosyl-L-methionine-dependent methyltransferase [Delitschia confertaspora ATCC 74209]